MQLHRKPHLLFALCTWSLLLLRFGYRYGTGDQVELLPYTLFLHDPSLYVHDFFIKGLDAARPNERTVMAYLLLPFVHHLEIFCFIFQMLTTVVLVLGMEKLALRFIPHRYFAWLAVWLTLIPLNDFGLGNVEVYSECLQASAVTTAIVIWGILFFLDRQYVAASVLLAVGTIVQVLDGLDVMMVLSAMLLLRCGEQKVSVKTLVTFFAIYACTAGIFLLLILYQKTASLQDGTAALGPQETFKVMFEFRHPHHFIFASFSKTKLAIYLAFTWIALVFFYKHSTQLFRFVVISTLGWMGYSIATDLGHLIFIADFQFYKVTQWVKFFGVVAALGFVSRWLVLSPKWRLPNMVEKAMLILGLVLSFIIIGWFHHDLPYQVPYQLFGMKQQDDMIRICEAIKASTPADAVFIQPFDNTELKFYAQRSSYVEFKANVRHKAYVGEWYRRIGQVFGVTDDLPLRGFRLHQKADDYFFHLSAAQLQQLRQSGVTHLLTRKEHPAAAGHLILQNNTYAVYQL